MKYKYRIGLDIGIDSVGWAALEHDHEENPIKIINLGTRIFSAAENPKDGKTLTQLRREARGARRRLRRRAHRIDRVKRLFLKYGLLKEEELNSLYDKENLMPTPDYPFGFDVYKARYLALEKKIGNQDLARILICIAKRRGFKSNRKSDIIQDKEGKELLKALEKNKAYRIENGYRTVGEMFYKDPRFQEQFYSDKRQSFLSRPLIRNSENDYSKTILLEENVEEVKTIFERQSELGNQLPQEFCEEYINILTSRRAFDEGPGEPSKYRGTFKVGNCTFEKDELRASKGCYTFEYFRALNNINHIKISLRYGKIGEPLTEDQRIKLIEKIKSVKSFTYAQARNLLGLTEEAQFSNLNYGVYDRKKKEYKDPEKAAISNFENSAKIKKVIRDASIEELDAIAMVLAFNKSDEKIKNALIEKTLIRPFSEEQISLLQDIKFEKFGHLSLKAMRKINEQMEKYGYTYDKACEAAGYDFRAQKMGNKTKFLNTKEVYEQVMDIPNPVVRRSVSQTIKVLNAIIREYGSPQAIMIELSREMAKSFEERNEIRRMQEENREYNESIKKAVREIKPNAVGIDFLKWKLFLEQQGICAYSLKKIDPSRVFEEGYTEVDHIIPYSRSSNNSNVNKVLVFKTENQAKKNMTPYEYYKSIGRDFSELEAFAENYIKNKKKKSYLLNKNFTEQDALAMQERALADTRYITKLIKNLIRDNLYFEESKKFRKSPVNPVNGSVTSFLRTRWGLSKIREKGDLHHAQDAVVIACTTRSMIKKVTTFFQKLENPYAKEFIDFETGEILTREEFFDRYSEKFPSPYPNFRKELIIRLFGDPLKECYIDELIKSGYTHEDIRGINRVFVSRMAKYKKKGKIFEDKIYSAKYKNTEGVYVIRTDIKNIKLDKNGEIEGYFKKESDWPTYNALKKRLIEHNGDAKKAFIEPIYKPKKDGTSGNIIRKVKIEHKRSLQELKNHNKSSAANDSQIRVDIFKKDNKFYMVPVYVLDYYKNRLPNKAIKANKPYEEWPEIDENYQFCFSLYPYELVYARKDKGFNMKSVANKLNKDKKTEKITIKEEYLYYVSINRRNGASSVCNHDNSFIGEVCFMGFDELKKCHIDLLGRVRIIDKYEKRKPLR
jgi:CRISPR-associated endonuclease Csn1